MAADQNSLRRDKVFGEEGHRLKTTMGHFAPIQTIRPTELRRAA
jgi:hypothetical protein